MRLTVLALLLAAPAAALSDFHYTSAADLKAGSVELPPLPPVDEGRPVGGSDVITEAHILVQAGKTVLFGHADTPEQAAAAAAYWTAALKPQGVEVGPVEYKNNFFTLPYKTADGRVLRYFLAESLQFPPKDEAGLRANMAASLAALGQAGLTPVSARVVNLDFLLPTYAILYLTQPNENRELEQQLRVLKTGDDMDPAVFAAGGVSVVQTPKPWMMVYIGPEAGYVSMAAGTRTRALEKLKARTDFLEKEGKRILDTKITHVDQGDYQYLIEVYFIESAAPAQLAKATMCRLSRIEKDDCVYTCNDGRERRSPVRENDPWDPRGPVIACPQIIFPF